MPVSFCQFTNELDEVVYINPSLVRSFVSWATYDDDQEQLTKIVFDNENTIVVKGSVDQALASLSRS